ncbi:MAG TPA: branched-chain amino acid transaminase [Pyrinomonadaceae bacterium]|nr:branched-chain amino acid transaminase [Chloracidobacterium sp.]MBP9936168.1 branched-chain amino acid transaminase [Pyrinomonadaceae bacterium]MBK7804492.1 branched-chain amino acid transaminase [Chloracidobacterium sp.]MBK9438893.1 branched-chain amino acid transaminase [Chloracidobacterium sp.]MBL0240424.1 branched-chain amino acid transaminase [Chloracidobacterium sp.]
MKISPKVWKNGQFIDWDDARIHVMSHVVNYGSSVFEGIRCYDTAKGPAVFRLPEHMQRLINSAKIYRMESPFSRKEYCDSTVELIRQSGLDECYIRPIIFRGLDEVKPAFGVNPFPNPIEAYIATWEWGKYLGDEALESGIDVCVSSWTRITSNSMPAMAKAGANYMNSQLIKMEALLGGFSEGIALDDRGYVSEGSGENIFLVNGGKLITPPLGASILPGITRDSIIQIARELGIEVIETTIQRAALYLADELFFTGTAAEVTPIRTVDRITVGSGKRGEITKRLQEEFFGVIRAERPAPSGKDWLTFVRSKDEKSGGSVAGS